jgi:hypothetical protein
MKTAGDDEHAGVCLCHIEGEMVQAGVAYDDERLAG